jgi:hypothetical protein
MKNNCIPLLFGFFITSLFSCKKDNTATVSIVGKWYITRHSSQILNNGTLLSSSTITKFTSNDFAQFYSDGSGYYSESVLLSPTIIEFNYLVKGNAITIYTNVVSSGNIGTITILALNSLSIHTEALIVDQNNPDQTDNEIDDYDYSKSN